MMSGRLRTSLVASCVPLTDSLERVAEVELCPETRVVDPGLALALGREELALARVVRRAPVAVAQPVVGHVVGAPGLPAAIRSREVRHVRIEHDQVAGLRE